MCSCTTRHFVACSTLRMTKLNLSHPRCLTWNSANIGVQLEEAPKKSCIAQIQLRHTIDGHKSSFFVVWSCNNFNMQYICNGQNLGPKPLYKSCWVSIVKCWLARISSRYSLQVLWWNLWWIGLTNSWWSLHRLKQSY